MAEKRPAGPVERATRSQLRRLAVSVQTDGRAASAVALARQLDRTVDASKAAAAAKELRVTLDQLAATSDARPTTDAVDELSAARDARRRA